MQQPKDVKCSDEPAMDATEVSTFDMGAGMATNGCDAKVARALTGPGGRTPLFEYIDGHMRAVNSCSGFQYWYSRGWLSAAKRMGYDVPNDLPDEMEVRK